MSGKFRDCYLMYNRQSMDEAESQKNSIEYQTRENRRAMEREGLSLANVSLDGLCENGLIAERHSGFKEGDDLFFSEDGRVQFQVDRPKFYQLIQFADAGLFRGVVCLCWDRISRNKGDDAIIRKLRRRGVDIRFALATYDNTSSGELHMDIDGMFAQHHSRVTSEKVRAANRKNREDGFCTYRAPTGYLNVGTMHNKPIDPQRGPIIAELFKLYATGDWSLSDLVRHADKQGLTVSPRRPSRTHEEMMANEQVVHEKVSRPVSKSMVGRILTNRFYAGWISDGNGGHIKSKSHKALVDDRTFELVQQHLESRKVSVHYTSKIDHPLRGLFRCAYCNRTYTPYEQKGIVYYGSKCAPGCKNQMRNCNLDYVSQLIKDQMSLICFGPDDLSVTDAALGTELALLEEKRREELERLDRARKKVREGLSYLRQNRLSLISSGAYSPEAYVQEVSQLEGDLDGLLEDEVVSEEAIRATMKDVTLLSDLLRNAAGIFESSEMPHRDSIARMIFSELRIAHDTVQPKLKFGLEVFLDKNVLLCAPYDTLSELYLSRDVMTKRIRKFSRLIEAVERS